MAEKEESFLEILNNYFSNLKETEMLDGEQKKITIPMEWLYSSKIDRDIIEQAFISLFCKANKQFKEHLKTDKENYGKVHSLEIEKQESGVNFIINANDGGTQTRIKVTSNERSEGGFYGINEEQLYDYILYSYNFKSSIEMAKKLNLSPEERKKLFKEELSKPELTHYRRKTVKEGMLECAKNLTKYYDYMSKKLMRYEAQTGIVEQRRDESFKKNRNDFYRDTTRKSEIYDFQERESILLDMDPVEIINIDIIEDNALKKFAYTTYIYENPRDMQGYLFIAEPFEGNHFTRSRFVSKEEYESMQVEEGKSKFLHISEELVEMSNGECSNSKFTKLFSHTSIEKFKEKFRRIVLGEEIDNPVERIRYKEIDQTLFEGKRKITKQGIKAQIEEVKSSDIPDARAALYGQLEKEKTNEE